MMWSNKDLAIISMTEEDLDRFLSKIDFVGKCWVWTGGRLPAGYGRFKIHNGNLANKRGSSVYAHRVSCWLRHGPPTKDKPTVDHLCKNTGCVNPEHLRWASHKEQVTFETNDSVKLDDETVVSIIKRVLNGETQTAVALDFGLRQEVVGDWVRGRRRPQLLQRAKEELSGSD